MTASAEHRPPEDHRPDERRKMTVSERNIGTLAPDLHDWPRWGGAKEPSSQTTD